MYFFDTHDFPFPKGSAHQSDISIFHRDFNNYSHYYLKDFVFVNNPDGTLGIYQDSNNFTGNTDNIQNFTSQITEEFCTILKNKFDETRNEIINAFYSGYAAIPNCFGPAGFDGRCTELNLSWFQTSTYENIPSCYWDKRKQKCVTAPDPLDFACCGDDFTIDFNELMTEPLANAATNEQFDEYLTTELIDVKNRKTISAYATLRALYDRYMHSSLYTGVQSSAYDYNKMDGIANMVGTYWVDVIEQVIPATTIWGSVKIYSNTMFDQQKFMYKKGTLFTCLGGSCSLKNSDFINECMGSILDKFYTDECPSLATITSTYYFGDE